MKSVSRVVVVGHATIDDIRHADGRLLAETPGGAAMYATIGAMMSGGAVVPVTLVGEDYPLDELRREPPVAGSIDLGHVGQRNGRSIRNEIRYGADSDRRIEVLEWDRMEELTPTAVDLPADLTRDDVVLLAPGSLPVQLELARALRRRGCRVAADS